jgi:hypothetical protein
MHHTRGKTPPPQKEGLGCAQTLPIRTHRGSASDQIFRSHQLSLNRCTLLALGMGTYTGRRRPRRRRRLRPGRPGHGALRHWSANEVCPRAITFRGAWHVGAAGAQRIVASGSRSFSRAWRMIMHPIQPSKLSSIPKALVLSLRRLRSSAAVQQR